MRVNMTNWEITKNAKYRATTARSKRDCVKAPWDLETQRIMMGKKKPKNADTAGGGPPETMMKQTRGGGDQGWRKGAKHGPLGSGRGGQNGKKKGPRSTKS